MINKVIILIMAALFLGGCGDRALFTELAENRVKVVLKGTYESNNPRSWEGLFPEDDSVDDCVSTPEDAAPSKFMFDLAEMRITDGKHTQRFANYRETYSFPLSDSSSFFNGSGVIYKNDDMRPDYTWRYIKMYIRKMLFDSAKKYYYQDNEVTDGLGEWVFYENDEDIFAEEEVPGLNFNNYYINSYYDSLLYQSGSINRIFPLKILIEDTFVFNKNIPETVLEIRMVVKNFIEMYELDYTSDSVHYVKHFYSYSDWLRNVKAGRTYSEAYGKYVNDCERMGGNLIAIARSYIPGETVTLTGSTGVTECYIVAINENHKIEEYELTLSERARPACDEPKMPILDLSGDTESVLDYFLEVAEYRDDYDAFIDYVQYDEGEESGQYDEEWEAYEDTIRDFNIPGIVTWTEAGNFTLTNVPVGHTYTIYRSECSGGTCAVNELPGDFYDTPVGTAIVTEEMAGQSVAVE